MKNLKLSHQNFSVFLFIAVSMLVHFESLSQNYTINTNSNTITITDVSSLSQSLSIYQSGSNLVFNAPTVSTYSINGGAITSFTTLPQVSLSGVTNIVVNLGGGTDNIGVNSFSNQLPNLTISSSGSGNITFNNNITFSANNNLTLNTGINTVTLAASVSLTLAGTGAVDIDVKKNITFGGFSHIYTVNGSLKLYANQNNTSTGNFVGINMGTLGASAEISGSGALNVLGRGGDLNSNNYGVYLNGSTLKGGNLATNSVNGYGGYASGNSNHGIYVTGGTGSIESSGGQLTVTAYNGGLSGSSNNVALNLNSGRIQTVSFGQLIVNGYANSSAGNGNIGVLLTAALVTSDNGPIGISGNSINNPGAQNTNRGVAISNGSSVTSLTGNIVISGNAGSAQGTSNSGVYIAGNGVTSNITTNNANISIVGTAGLGGAFTTNNHGVDIQSNVNITAGTNGSIILNGTGSAASAVNSGVIISGTSCAITAGNNITIEAYQNNDNGTYGSFLMGSSATLLCNNSSGSISIKTHTFNVGTSASITSGTTGSVSILNASNGSTFKIGDADNGTIMGLAGAELDRIFTTKLNIGDSNSGQIRIINTLSRSSATTVTLTAASIKPEIGTDISLGTGNLIFGATSTLNVNIADISHPNYQKLDINGSINLNNCGLSFNALITPTIGNVFTIVENDGTDAIVGTFNSLPQGAVINNFLNSGLFATISYTGGTGNDVTLTVGAPDYLISNNSGNLVITNAIPAGETVSFSQSGSNLIFTAPSNRTYSINGSAVVNFGTNPSIPIAGLNTIVFNAAGGNDVININAFTSALPDFTINGDAGDDVVNVSGNITFTSGKTFDVDLQNDLSSPGTDIINIILGADIITSGSGNIYFKASKNINIFSGAIIRTVNGNLSLEANQQTLFSPSSGNFIGININNALIEVTGAGVLTVKGKGGNSSTDNHGIFLQAGGIIRGGTAGSNFGITATGGASSGAGNSGLSVSDAGSLITSYGSDIVINATGGGTTSSGNFGLALFSGGAISAGNNGNISITSNTTATNGSNIGVYVLGANTEIVSNGGNLTITSSVGGLAVSGNTGNHGIAIDNGGRIYSNGSGTLNLTGNSGFASSANNYGIYAYGNNTLIGSSNGNVNITGVSRSSNTFTASYGIGITLLSGATIAASGIGNLVVNGTGATSSSGVSNHGIWIYGTGSKITSFNGTLNVTGNAKGSGSTSTNNYGLFVEAGALIKSLGTGIVHVNGTTGLSTGTDNYAVYLKNGTISSSGANVNVTGTCSSTNTSGYNHGVKIESLGTITAEGSGTVTVQGFGGKGGNNNHGIYIIGNGAVITSSGGNVNVTGNSTATNSTGNNVGVKVETGGMITAGGSGSVSVQGTGGVGGTNNYGVNVTGTSSMVSSSGGSVNVTGTGGSGTSASLDHNGIHIASGGIITAGANGNVTVVGNSGPSSSVRYGVIVKDAGSKITSNGGNVTVTGNMPASFSGGNASALFITNGGNISAGGNGVVTVNGNNYDNGSGSGMTGVRIQNATVTSAGGNIIVNGNCVGAMGSGVMLINGGQITSGSAANIYITGISPGFTANGFGVYLYDFGVNNTKITSAGDIVIDAQTTLSFPSFQMTASPGIINTSSTGTLTIKSNSSDIYSNISMAAGGTVNLIQNTNNNPINLGATDALNLLGLQEFESDLVNTSNLNYGNANTGAMSISAAITRNAATNITLTSSALTPDFNGTDINTAGGAVILPSTTNLVIDIDGTTANTQYKQFAIDGLVNINNASLLYTGSSYVPSGGEIFTIITNDGTDAVVGNFNGLPEGTTINNFLGSTKSARISYVGGTGNDVTITVCTVPTLSIASYTNAVCLGTQVTLTASGALSYSWTGGISNGVAFTPALGNNLYTVTGSNGQGCVSNAVAFIQVIGLPTATIIGSTSVCQNGNSPVIKMIGAGGSAPYNFTYTINNGTPINVTSSNGDTAYVSMPTNVHGIYTYTLQQVGSAWPCTQTQSGSVEVRIHPAPSYNISANPTTACIGENISFSSIPTCNTNAIAFTGTGQASRNLPVTTVQNNVTIEAWVNWNGIASGNSMIVLNGNSGGNGYAIYHNNGSLRGLLGGVAFLTSNLTLTANTWQHVALIRNAGTWSLYLNGVAGTLTNSSATPNIPNTGTFVGSNNAFGERFRGSIDEVRIWNRALSLIELNSFRYSCTIVAQNGLVAYWNFNEGSGTTANDLSGNNLSLTIANGTYSNPANQGFTGNWNFGDASTSIGFNATHPYLLGNSYIATFTTNDLNGCVSQTSVPVTINNPVAPSVSIAITSGSQNSCSGTSITLTATSVNGGSSPSYSWTKNGFSVGINSPTFTDNNFSNNDAIACILTSNQTCLTTTTANSNTINLSIIPSGTWLGVNSSWNDAINWCGGIPTPTSDIIINGAVTFKPSLSQTAYCHNITFSNNAYINLFSQELVIAGEVSGAGKFYSTESSILSFVGNGDAGTIYFNQSSSSGHSLWDLNINKNGGSITLGDSLWIYHILTLDDGTLNTNNHLRLKTINIPNVFTNTARIAPVGASAVINGNIIAEQFAPGGLTGWALLGSPVTNATISDWTSPWPASGFPTSGFTGSTGYAGGFISIYGYNETVAGPYDTGYEPASNITNVLTNGKGFYTYLGTGSVNTNDIYFSVYGAPQYGQVNLNVSYTNTNGGNTADGWNLIANPYACDIDWLSNDWIKNNVDDAIYIYNADYGNMASYVAGIGTNGGTPNIAAHQGFFVKANSSSPQLIASENTKVLNSNTLLKNSSNPNDDALIRVKLSQQGILLTDETVVRFNSNAQQNFDGTLEAYKVYPQQTNANYIMTTEVYGDLAISAFDTLHWNTMIPMKLKVNGNGIYSLHFTELESVFQAYPDLFINNYLVIENLQNNSITPLSNSMNYSFDINNNDSILNFVIRFNNQTMGTGNLHYLFNSVKCTYQTDGYVLDVHFMTPSNIEIQVLNTLGQIVLPIQTDQTKEGKYKINTHDLAEGIYFIKAITAQKEYIFKIKGN
ncbi:MAG TPA: hypothetical protein PK323_08160 [Bacteroidia bacterium]|nr:hypothetical protein [Bacteroidia bacterium]